MSQLTSPSLSRAPASVRKIVQIIRDPVILTSLVTVTALVSFGTYYYSTRRKYSSETRRKIKKYHIQCSFFWGGSV